MIACSSCILFSVSHLFTSLELYPSLNSLQTQPLLLSVSATVTPSEITFNTHSINFGPCTTHESVTATLQLTNTSLLPQSFGFVSLPACIDVQPGDGFGEILPQETLTVDVVFSASKPREYSFELTVKTALDK